MTTTPASQQAQDRRAPGPDGMPSGVRVAVAAPSVDPEPRPHRNLLVYYALGSLVLGPFFWAILIPQYFRYHTLRYRFDDEGVSMSWGILFRREISLTYARIQDIHLTSNLLERWLGLAKIQIQTASGSAGAEMTIEGLQAFERIRDFLYSRMRGARERSQGRPVPEALPTPSAAIEDATLRELETTLRAVAAEVRALRLELTGEQPEAGHDA